MGMTMAQNMLVSISLVIWFALIVVEIIRKKAQYAVAFGIQFVLIIGSAVILHTFFGYFNTLEIKSVTLVEEAVTLAGLYFSTILGIIGHHLFVQLKGLQDVGKQKKIRWMPVFKPLVISPLIFLAVLNELTKMNAQANTLTAMVTQCVLAFQNGFFWKTVMEQFEKTKEGEVKA